jgi:hypothetical protein
MLAAAASLASGSGVMGTACVVPQAAMDIKPATIIKNATFTAALLHGNSRMTRQFPSSCRSFYRTPKRKMRAYLHFQAKQELARIFAGALAAE